jgi:hypothetical protein
MGRALEERKHTINVTGKKGNNFQSPFRQPVAGGNLIVEEEEKEGISGDNASSQNAPPLQPYS